MSPVFLRWFRGQQRCKLCGPKGPKVKSEYGLCPTHKRRAKLAWRVWAFDRKLAGLCCDCDVPAQPNTGRCRTHRRSNLARVVKWQAAHPGHSALAWAKSKAVYIDVGLCRCSAHSPLPAGQRRCDPCRERSRMYSNPNHPQRAAVLARVKSDRLRIRLQRAAEAAAALRDEGLEMSRGAGLRRIRG